MEYLQNLHRDLQLLQPFLTDSGNLTDCVKYLVDFMGRYLQINKIALVLLSKEGKVEDCTWWGREDSFDQQGFETFLSNELIKLHSIFMSGGTVKDEELTEYVKRAVKTDSLNYFPTIFPVFHGNDMVGMVYFGKKEGAWTGDEKQLIKYLQPIISIFYSNKRLQFSSDLQKWVFNEFMNQMDTNLYVTDIETDEILFMNDAMKKLFRIENPIGKTCWKVLQTGLKERCSFCPLEKLTDTQNPPQYVKWEELNTITGRTFQNYDSLMKWKDGRIVHFQQSVDITHSKELNLLANYDDLTGVLNRRAGKNKLEKLMDDAHKELKDVTVCMYDINHLKVINDNFGHTIGDMLIKLAAETVKSQLSENDLIFRLSGDEFIIAFYGLNFHEADKKMALIIRQLDDVQAKEKHNYHVGFSYGLYQILPEELLDMSEILTKVDENMYEQKRNYHRSQLLKQYHNISGNKEIFLWKEQYDAALQNLYDELYELNVTQNTYRIVYHVPNKYVTPSEQGILSDGILDVSEHMIFHEDKQRFLEMFDLQSLRNAFAAGRENVVGEFRKLWTDGKHHWASLTVFPVKDEKRKDEIFLCFIMDIDGKKRADEIEQQNRILRMQRVNDERYRIVVQQTGTMLFEWNWENSNYFISADLRNTFCGSYDSRDIFDIWFQDQVVYSKDRGKLKKLKTELQQNGCQSNQLVRLKKRKGGYRWCRLTMSLIRDENGKIVKVIGTVNDVDDSVKSELTMQYRADYDLLTGIFNMHSFYEHARELLVRCPGQKHAIIRFDIGRFRFINDLYGYEEGDKLLKFMAQAIKKSVSNQGVFGRMSGDIFLICTPFSKKNDLVSLIDRISDELSRYSLGYKISCYFGICMVEDHSIPVSTLCDWANMALGTVKGNMLLNYAFYDDELRAKQLQEREIENEMEKALHDGQFTIHLQPKYDIKTSKIIGAEALARWTHPTMGMITPNRFIPIFEKNGFIIPFDRYIWELTFQTLAQWKQQGLELVPVSINVSRLHLYDPDLSELLAGLLDKYGLSYDMIELELTESMFAEDTEELCEMVSDLKNKGFRFSMDDFGTGYSSLNLLKTAPVNTIKLDRGFLNEAVTSERGKTIVKYTISMAKDLDMDVISEGVETKEQADFLLKAGCTAAQGFYFSKPVPVKEFEQMLFGK